MEKFLIKGGKTLKGSISLSGAKNSALKVLCASILSPEKIRLYNFPIGMEDIKEQIKMLESIGAKISAVNDVITVDGNSMKCDEVIMNPNKGVRTSLLMLGSMLGRFGKSRVPIPGGDRIGERNFDLHIYALECLGAEIKVEKNFIDAECNELKGAEIEFPIQTTGGTENAMLASCLAKGTTIIKNAHTRPEVIDLANFLNSMGARIKIKGLGYIEIEGVKELYGTSYRIIPDSVEALTFTVAAILTKGDVEIKQCPIKSLEIPLIYLKESGACIYEGTDSLMISQKNDITLFDLSTGPYPGINSDFQPLFAVLATQALGNSKITDIRFPKRFNYAEELRKLGANISIKDNSAYIKGGIKLKGSMVNATDIRTGASLIAAALCAEGETIIENIYQIDRGYESIEKKLSYLGADIRRINQ